MADKIKKSRRNSKTELLPSDRIKKNSKSPNGNIENAEIDQKNSRRRQRKNVINDDISGCILQKCNGQSEVYWKSVGISPLPSGSISVLNKCDCPMTVRADTSGDGIADTLLFTLNERGQAKSISLGSIAEIFVSFEGEDSQIGSGQYSLTIHYHIDACV
ncbi:S-Ena type endospore appendage [Peribacillus sp. NPDC097675]|uniref:S-Ena type endospore appendage n=1 Tax=Peribacillus sp. NPDC097675 TaxID=3390618 RepID=UPI003D046303